MNINRAIERARNTLKGRLDGHYQHEGVRWMLEREFKVDEAKGGILADDMGLGKTMQAIATMRGNPMKTLIVTIVGTIGQWRDALIEFGGYRPIIINPSFSGILPQDVDVAITTYTCFQKTKGTAACFYTTEWGRIILDEGHMIRNAKTKVFQEISKLKCSVKWILSGTPIQNSHKDLLNLAQWIGYTSNNITEIVSNIVLRRTQDELSVSNPRLALPPLDTNIIRLKFESEEEEAFYHKIEMECQRTTKSKNDAMEALLRCRQASTHPMLYIDAMIQRNKKRKIENPPHTCSKFNFLINDIVIAKEKSLIFCTWTMEIKLLQNMLKEKGISSLVYDGKLSRDNKEAVLYNFKNASILVLILQINCGATGLNLQCASRVYITSPHWNPCIELQAIGRAYRKGQLNKVTCLRLVMADTIEEKCIDVQKGKVQVINDTMCDDSLCRRLGEDEFDFTCIFEGMRNG